MTEKLSKSYKNEIYRSDKQFGYIEELASKNMRDDYVAGAGLEAPTQEDIDEGWTQKNQSPLAGRMCGTMEELERIQSSEMMTVDELHEGIKDSLDCYQICTETILRCVTLGGKHAEPEHINLLLDCAKICSANADFMLRSSTYYPQICGICADICDECGDTCDRFEDVFMKECASVCRRCAEFCREMAR